MPGPLPKDPAIRQHRIKRSTRAILPVEANPIEQAPRLPAHPLGEDWHAMTRRWWKDVWDSPMAAEYLRADAHGLFQLAVLRDAFWKSPSVDLSREIRMMSQLFGLSPIDRRRLEWQVAQSEEAKDKHEKRRMRQARPINGDPRGVLE